MTLGEHPQELFTRVGGSPFLHGSHLTQAGNTPFLGCAFLGRGQVHSSYPSSQPPASLLPTASTVGGPLCCSSEEKLKPLAWSAGPAGSEASLSACLPPSDTLLPLRHSASPAPLPEAQEPHASPPGRESLQTPSRERPPPVICSPSQWLLRCGCGMSVSGPLL